MPTPEQTAESFLVFKVAMILAAASRTGHPDLEAVSPEELVTEFRSALAASRGGAALVYEVTGAPGEGPPVVLIDGSGVFRVTIDSIGMPTDERIADWCGRVEHAATVVSKLDRDGLNFLLNGFGIGASGEGDLVAIPGARIFDLLRQGTES